MSETRRASKHAGTWDAVRELQHRLNEEQTELESLQASAEQARKVADRWEATHRRRRGAVLACESRICDITRALDILAPEVDEYGIARNGKGL